MRRRFVARRGSNNCYRKFSAAWPRDHSRCKASSRSCAKLKVSRHPRLCLLSTENAACAQACRTFLAWLVPGLQRGRASNLNRLGVDGMTAEEIAECACIPAHTVRRELRIAQAWLRKELSA
jgi:hypothetical protein